MKQQPLELKHVAGFCLYVMVSIGALMGANAEAIKNYIRSIGL